MQSGSMDADAAVPALPDDVLAAILGRLMASSLATSRCVCKAWRDLVDERRLLLRIRHLLPHSVSGMFVNYVDHEMPHFFGRPSSWAAAAAVAAAGPQQVDGNFSYVVPEGRTESQYMVADHCNGLVLYKGMFYGELYVCNPTTRRWVHLPRLAGTDVWLRRAYLAFSPAVSRHYKVLVAPLDLAPVEYQRRREEHPAGDAEWPPSRWRWHVFSSKSGRWQERVFVRRGEAAGNVADVRMDPLRNSPKSRWRYAVYRQGALYVHCSGEYVSRLSLSTGDYYYRVMKSPIDRSEHYIHHSQSCCDKDVRSYLGSSKGEVYFVAINNSRLRVWMLNDHESQQHDPTAGSEWILKHDRVLRVDALWDQGPGPYWILDDYYINWKMKMRRRLVDWISDGDSDGDDNDDDIICSIADGEEEEEKHEADHYNGRKERMKLVDWSSDGDDDDDIICSVIADGEEEKHDVCPEPFHFLGFHPYKEVMFLAPTEKVVAYHLSTSKVQYLGGFRPYDWNCGLCDSFVYTPCHDLRHRE